MMSFINTNYAILTPWPMSRRHRLLDLWSCEIAMAFTCAHVMPDQHLRDRAHFGNHDRYLSF
jgi:hypothetical protein